MSIRIFHANDSLLYFPVLFANICGNLGKEIELKKVDSDVNTIKALTEADATRKGLNIAVCDPVAGDLSIVSQDDGRDQTRIIGSLISGIPFWVFANQREEGNENVRLVQKEAELGSLLTKFGYKHIVCNQPGNTSEVFGQRLKSLSKSFQADALMHSNFGNEWSKFLKLGEDISPDAILLTADVLAISANQNLKKLFDFSSEESENEYLYPYLFTGVITLNSHLDKYLPEILGILKGMRISVQRVRNAVDRPDDVESLETFEILLNIYRPEFDRLFREGLITQEQHESFDEKLSILQRSLSMMLGPSADHVSNLYKWLEYESPSEEEFWKATLNADMAWRESTNQGPQTLINLRSQTSILPSILIKDEWYANLFNSKKNYSRLRNIRRRVNEIKFFSTKKIFYSSGLVLLAFISLCLATLNVYTYYIYQNAWNYDVQQNMTLGGALFLACCFGYFLWFKSLYYFIKQDSREIRLSILNQNVEYKEKARKLVNKLYSWLIILGAIFLLFINLDFPPIH